MRPHLIVAALVAAALAVIALAEHRGYARGEAAAVARHEAERLAVQRRLFAAGEELSRQGVELDRLRADQETRTREFEDVARGNPADHRPGIGPDGLRQLDRLWRAP